MGILTLNPDNIADQHICCAFSDKKCRPGYEAKKAWLTEQFQNGYTFRKLDERGKVFMEYVPIEHSWLPLDGKNFMVINCFWVSGKFKGNGYGKELLEGCLADAEGMDGIVAVASGKKRPFMSDPKFFKRMGFEVIDEAPPFFQLYGLKLKDDAVFPRFMDSARQGKAPDNGGISAYFSPTCPFTDYYIKQHLANYAAEKGVPLDLHFLDSQEKARKMPIPWIINSIFYKGELVTLEIKADRKLDKLIGE